MAEVTYNPDENFDLNTQTLTLNGLRMNLGQGDLDSSVILDRVLAV